MEIVSPSSFSNVKILATLGPATNSKENIIKLIQSGVNGIRVNFSHGGYDFFQSIFDNIHAACVETSSPIAILQDLQGPKIRIGLLAEKEYQIKSGDKIELTNEEMLGTKDKVSTSYKLLPKDSQIGDIILVDDGLLKFQIIKKTENSVICEIIEGGVLKPKKGMNLPGMKLSTPAVTKKDLSDLEFALKNRIDYIALSFVRSPADILDLRNWLNNRGVRKPIVAKIEKKEAIDNFEEILTVADGIMVARGDLGVELAPQFVPIIQKKIIKRCNEVGKLVITATQMLESMIVNPVPTRAEASDVANAVWDGTEVVMLSGETAVGKYPYDTVKIMKEIITTTEANHEDKKPKKFDIPALSEENLYDSMGRAVVSISKQVKAAAIVVFTHQGRSALNLTKYRPNARIVAVTNSFDAMNKLSLRWGVNSVFLENIFDEEKAVEYVKKELVNLKICQPGETVVLTAGGPYFEGIRKNWIRYETV